MDAISTPRMPLAESVDDGRLETIKRMDGERGRAAAAKELQVVFFSQLIAAMRKTIPESSLLQKSAGRDVYEGLFDRELAQALAAGDPLGLARELGGAESAEAADGVAASRAPQGTPPEWRAALGVTLAAAAAAAGRGAGDPHAPASAAAPVAGRISSPYGPRRDPVSGLWEIHRGVDLAAPAGAPVRAVADGRVVASGWHGAAGRRVVIEHAAGYRTVYAHAGRTFVRKDDEVEAGQEIATVGATGRATGPHLHFEVHRSGVTLDPARASLTAAAVRRAVDSERPGASSVSTEID
jgi:murein DD-endopeptidase MepM/ murein hydrolase activator NlpD